MKVNGSCHCGAITYEAEVDPERVGVCHCTDCQVLTGSAFRVSVPAPAQTFRLLTGHPKTYLKTADSGAQRAQAFCFHCGSPLYTYAVDHPVTFGLRVGCLDQRAELRRRRQKWYRSALPWSMNIADLPRHETE